MLMQLGIGVKQGSYAEMVADSGRDKDRTIVGNSPDMPITEGLHRHQWKAIESHWIGGSSSQVQLVRGEIDGAQDVGSRNNHSLLLVGQKTPDLVTSLDTDDSNDVTKFCCCRYARLWRRTDSWEGGPVRTLTPI